MTDPDLGPATLIRTVYPVLGTACTVEWCRAHTDDRIGCGDAAGPFYEGLTHRGRVNKARRAWRRLHRVLHEAGVQNVPEALGLREMLLQAPHVTRPS